MEIEIEFNKKYPYIKWKDLIIEDDYYKHTLTERLFSYSNGEWIEIKSKISPPKYRKITPVEKILRKLCCYVEYSYSVI
jgi:hypothetical protein